jgi:hypothetical protein
VHIGDSGTGKTHLLIALGIAACEQGRRVRYATCAQLVNELVEAADVSRTEPSIRRRSQQPVPRCADPNGVHEPTARCAGEGSWACSKRNARSAASADTQMTELVTVISNTVTPRDDAEVA